MIKALAVVAALSILLTAGSGAALLMGCTAATGHAALGLFTLMIILFFSHQVYWKYSRR